MTKSLRTKLAAAIEVALLADFGVKVLIEPEALHPAKGWYRTSPQADCFRWSGTGRWQVEGSDNTKGGLSVSVDSWDTMTNCVKRGIKVGRESGTSFEVHSN